MMNLLYCGQLNKEYKQLLRLQVTSFAGKRRQVHKGWSFTCEVDTKVMHAKSGRCWSPNWNEIMFYKCVLSKRFKTLHRCSQVQQVHRELNQPDTPRASELS